MADGMKCVKCSKRRATVKMVRIVGGKAHSFHLCEQCAAEISPYQQQTLSLQEAIEKVLAQLVQKQQQEAEAEQGDEPDGPQCPSCGTTSAAYRKSFLLGCPQCYAAFEDILEAQLRRLHGSTRHVGRSPQSRPAVESRDSATPTLETLKDQLASAVSNQDFEKAAELRDRIRSLESRPDRDSAEVPEV